MNSRGLLAKLQKSGSRFYLRLAQHFSENSLIRDTWSAMAQDLEHQAASIKALRPSFWKQLKKQEKDLRIAVGETSSTLVSKNSEPWSLHHCFLQSLDFEEPLTLKLYLPLLCRLRMHWTEQALDFYILVNAHLTRISRLIQSFSGDPTLVQRCADLVLRFEREMQAPVHEPAASVKKQSRKIVHERRQGHTLVKRAGQTRPHLRARTGTSRALPKSRKALSKSAKPLLKLARRRVRR